MRHTTFIPEKTSSFDNAARNHADVYGAKGQNSTKCSVREAANRTAKALFFVARGCGTRLLFAAESISLERYIALELRDGSLTIGI